MMQRITSDQFQVSTWAGGTTTQLMIDPPGADFKERTFRYRLSSATFTGLESTFSDFSGYQRIIFPLVGTLSVDHSSGEQHLYGRQLQPYEVEHFSGSWTTRSTNSADCVDFNLIVRNDLAGHLEIVSSEETMALSHRDRLLFYSRDPYTLEFRCGETQEHISAEAGELICLDGDHRRFAVTISPSGAPVVVGIVTDPSQTEGDEER